MVAELEIHSTKRISRRTMVKGLAVVVLTISEIGCVSPGSFGSITPTPTSPPLGTILFTYRGHSHAVNAIAWSRDGKRIAPGSYDRTVQVWDAANGGNVYTYHGHLDDVFAVVWSPDGKRIASGSKDKTVQVWEAA